MGEAEAHRRIPVSLTVRFLSSEVCAPMCKAHCTPSVTARQHCKVRNTSLTLPQDISQQGCVSYQVLCKSRTNSIRNEVALDGVSNSPDFCGTENVKAVPAGFTHTPAWTYPVSRYKMPLCPLPSLWHAGRWIAASTRPALGRNGPSLTREATLGVGSALLGFLCQGKEICNLRFLV